MVAHCPAARPTHFSRAQRTETGLTHALFSPVAGPEAHGLVSFLACPMHDTTSAAPVITLSWPSTCWGNSYRPHRSRPRETDLQNSTCINPHAKPTCTTKSLVTRLPSGHFLFSFMQGLLPITSNCSFGQPVTYRLTLQPTDQRPALISAPTILTNPVTCSQRGLSYSLQHQSSHQGSLVTIKQTKQKKRRGEGQFGWLLRWGREDNKRKKGRLGNLGKGKDFFFEEGE